MLQVTLSNGLRIFMLEDHEIPVVHGSLLMRGGQRASPSDKVCCPIFAALRMPAISQCLASCTDLPPLNLLAQPQHLPAAWDGIISRV